MNFVEFLKKHRGLQPPLPDMYGDWLGYEVSSYDPQTRTLETTLTIRHDHLSPSGAVHGGVVSGFLDFSCGCAVFSVIPADMLCSTVDLTVKYFRPLKEGDTIRAQARVVHLGRSLSTVVGELFRIKGSQGPELVASAMGTFNIYPVQNSRLNTGKS